MGRPWRPHPPVVIRAATQVRTQLSDRLPRLWHVVRGRPEPDPAYVARVGALALRLPAAVEEDAWTGVRWRVRGRTFAHVVALHHHDAAARLGVTDGSTVSVVSLRSAGEERAALAAIGPPYLASWSEEVVSVVLDGTTDWDEVGELVTESYRLVAPASLVRRLET